MEQNNATSVEKLKSFVDEAKRTDKMDAGITGHASWVLKGPDGTIKQEGSTKNKITARGIDYIISHLVTSSWPSGVGYNVESASQYHGQYNSTNYIVGDPDKNPFAYIALLYLNSAGDSGKQPTFSEGIGSTLYYMHYNTSTDGQTGKDVQTYDEIIGDSDNTHYTSGTAHVIGSNGESTNRTKILGGQQLASKNASSTQSNQDAGGTPHFEKVYLIFNFGATEAVCNGSDTINNIAWMSWDSTNSIPGKNVGARLYVNPGISKQNGDTLDITYTFDLTPS
jgi:hypothetical protein